MKLINILQDNREEIIEKWFVLILNTYNEDSSSAFRKKTSFDNPIGSIIRVELINIFDGLLSDYKVHLSCNGSIVNALNNIIKIRAVQDLQPAEAAGFIFLLKDSIREKVSKLLNNKPFVKELLEFETRIDEAASIGFNIYMKHKERLYNIKANESIKTFGKLLERTLRKLDIQPDNNN